MSAKTVFLSTFQAWHVSDTDAHRHRPIQCAMGVILPQQCWSFFLGETVEKKKERKLVNMIIFEQVIPVPLGWFIRKRAIWKTTLEKQPSLFVQMQKHSRVAL